MHRGPELLLKAAEVSAGMVVRCQGMVSFAGGNVIPCQLWHVRGLNPDCSPREVPGSGRVYRFLLLRAYRYILLKEVFQSLYIFTSNLDLRWRIWNWKGSPEAWRPASADITGNCFVIIPLTSFKIELNQFIRFEFPCPLPRVSLLWWLEVL